MLLWQRCAAAGRWSDRPGPTAAPQPATRQPTGRSGGRGTRFARGWETALLLRYGRGQESQSYSVDNSKATVCLMKQTL